MSPALTEESSLRSESALLNRIASEVQYDDELGVALWPSNSDYHRLPTELKVEVCRRVARNNEALAEHGL